MSRTWKIVLGVTLAIAALAVIGNLLPTPAPTTTKAAETATAPPRATATATPTASPKPKKTETPVTPKTTEPADYAAEIRQATLDALGVNDFADACLPTDPGWTCYVTDWQSPSRGTIVVTLQVTGNDPDADVLGRRAALSVFNFTGRQHTDLRIVQVRAADGKTLQTMRRDQAPLLNTN